MASSVAQYSGDCDLLAFSGIRITPVKEACFMSRKSRGRVRGRKDRERIVRNLAFLAQLAAEEKKHQEGQVGPKVAKPKITAR